MSLQTIRVPDIGDFKDVEIIEVLVNPGDTIKVEDSLITVESDKASMEIPSPVSGTIKTMQVKVGDRVSEGSMLLTIDVSEELASPSPTPTPAPKENQQAADTRADLTTARQSEQQPSNALVSDPSATPAHDAFKKAYATPSIRKFARELGVDLSKVTGTGRKGRITQEDVKAYVKDMLNFSHTHPSGISSGAGIPPMPDIDFSQWGDIETLPLSRINKLTGEFLHRNWLNIPHVTQFDQADISDLEAFRKQLNKEQAKNKGAKVTPLVFIMKAVVAGLKAYPRFNSSLAPDGATLIQKKYYHIGIAVDTADGLLVPVIRHVDKKSLLELSEELLEVSAKARGKKLKPAELQGGCFSISSLGGVGGTQFTPIINAPEVAILGVSRAEMQPVWNGKKFKPRLMLPLSLSYDHRVIDGAEGARFTAYLSKLLGDIRRLLI